MTLSDDGARLIRGLEEFRADSYLDVAGVWTIGYGTTRLNGSPVGPGMAINLAVADALFLGDTHEAAQAVTRYVHVPLMQNQFDALVSLTYNIGEAGFAHSTLCREINARRPIVADYFTRWCKVRDALGTLVQSDGLIARRRREYELFMREDI